MPAAELKWRTRSSVVAPPVCCGAAEGDSSSCSYVQRVSQPGPSRFGRSRRFILIVYWPGVAVALLAVVAYAEPICGCCQDFGGIPHTPLHRCGRSPAPTMVPVVDRRDRSHQPTGHDPAGDQRHDKVESVQIDVHLRAHVFDYGNVTILHREGFKTLRTIANPVDLRKQHHRKRRAGLGLQDLRSRRSFHLGSWRQPDE